MTTTPSKIKEEFENQFIDSKNRGIKVRNVEVVLLGKTYSGGRTAKVGEIWEWIETALKARDKEWQKKFIC